MALIFYSRAGISFNSCNDNAARSVHCLLSKTDIFASKVAERQAGKTGVVKY